MWQCSECLQFLDKDVKKYKYNLCHTCYFKPEVHKLYRTGEKTPLPDTSSLDESVVTGNTAPTETPSVYNMSAPSNPVPIQDDPDVVDRRDLDDRSFTKVLETGRWSAANPTQAAMPSSPFVQMVKDMIRKHRPIPVEPRESDAAISIPGGQLTTEPVIGMDKDAEGNYVPRKCKVVDIFGRLSRPPVHGAVRMMLEMEDGTVWTQEFHRPIPVHYGDNVGMSFIRGNGEPPTGCSYMIDWGRYGVPAHLVKPSQSAPTGFSSRHPRPPLSKEEARTLLEALYPDPYV